MKPVKDTLCFSSPSIVPSEAVGLLWMTCENGDFVHNYSPRADVHTQPTAYAKYLHACVCVCMCVRVNDSVYTAVPLLAFVHIMLRPTQVLRPQRKSTANNSTATGRAPYHPRGRGDRVYIQSWSEGE